MTASNSVYTRLRVLTAAAVTASALALSGCAGGAPGGSGTPSTPAPSPSTSSATPTPTPSAAYKPADAKGKAQNVPLPVMPEAAKAETKEGLEAFAKYWYASLSYAYETGDVAPVSSGSDPNCVFCKGLIGGVTTAWQDGRWIVGGQIETASVTASVKPSAASHHATIQVVQQKLEIHKPGAGLYQQPTAISNTASQATAVFGSGGWMFTDLGLIR
ncbi:DUF6318 family protein [Arthrobacter sp. SA17]